MKKKWFLPIFASFMIFSGHGANQAEAASASDLTNTALSYIGAPYKYGGTSITYGIDCSAYTQLVFSKMGIQLNRTSSGQYQQGVSVSKSNLQIGDLVFFNTSGRGISHVGIYIGNGKFVSATTSGGVKVDSINDPYYWGNKYVGAKRITKFTNEQIQEVKAASVDFNVYASRGKVAEKLVEILGLDTSDTNSPFRDISANSKFAGVATALYKKGAFTGDPDGKFNPNSPITRAELSKVLVIAFGLKLQPDVEQFKDIKPDHWAYENVSILSSNKVTIGIGDGLFGGNKNVRLDHLDLFIERAKEIE
ncbi:NlpC/P60 family protein [Ureibacillus sp. MALMAid1270]|uniref:C40 family peptidase n=1 Tax=Ureibacillus sp. MALMAid1270 TaxID=3411629 RepID=UPI003BA7AD6C